MKFLNVKCFKLINILEMLDNLVLQFSGQFSVCVTNNSNLTTNRYCILTVLKDTTAQLDFRVTILEENGGCGNSSVDELEVRVETLEDTVSNHETRLTVGESELEGMFSLGHITLVSI